MVQLIGKESFSPLSQLLKEFFAGQNLSWRVETFLTPIPPDSTREKTILLFQDSFDGLEDFSPSVLAMPPENTVAIANAQNIEVLKKLEGTAIRAIPCGLSSWDTFTLASSTEESQVVALQRSIVSFRGETVEPMEFPVRNPRLLRLSRYGLMAFCAVGCLEGEIPGLLAFLSEKGTL